MTSAGLRCAFAAVIARIASRFLGPDVIAASSFPVAQAVLQRTQTIPVVFINVGDPVAGGLLKSIPRPEGNATGVTSTFLSLGGKWLDLLKEAAPRTDRAGLIFAVDNVNKQYFAVINAGHEPAVCAVTAQIRGCKIKEGQYI
jgi:ABC-type uncharacterized transport system substrate-binding protein